MDTDAETSGLPRALAHWLLRAAPAGAAIALLAALWPGKPPDPSPAPGARGARLEIHLQRAGERGTYRVLSATDVPLRTGDRIQIHARLDPPLAAYLIAVSDRAEPTLLYPRDGKPAAPVREIHLPPGRDEWFPIVPPTGTETVVLIARPRPVRDVEALRRTLLAVGPAPTLRERGLLWVDATGPRLIPRDRVRSIGTPVLWADKGFLARLLERVPVEWSVIRAISFPHEPPDPSPAPGARPRQAGQDPRPDD